MLHVNVRVVLSLVLVFFIICDTNEKPLDDPENTKLYQQIASGLGLYSNFKLIPDLTTTNFEDIVYKKKGESSKTWLIEFYNSWCGHCHRFAPFFKSLAVDVQDWQGVLRIGAVDCSNDINNQLCRDYEIMSYPSLKVFPAFSNRGFLGKPFEKGNVTDMRKRLAEQIEYEDSNDIKRYNLDLKPFQGSNLDVLWTEVPFSIKHIVLLFVQSPDTDHLGTTIALDFYDIDIVHVTVVHSDNKGLVQRLSISKFPSVCVIERNNSHELLHLLYSKDLRDDVYNAIKSHLTKNYINVPNKENPTIKKVDVDVQQIMKMIQMMEEIKKKLNANDLSDIVFQVDIEKALRYSLNHEITGYKEIKGEKLEALKNYLILLCKYFPIGNQGRKFLEGIRDNVVLKNVVYGNDFSLLLNTTENKNNDGFLPEQDWIGCKGSIPSFRGYPCGLWTMFHTLTVQADFKKDFFPGSDSQEVLKAVTGYGKHFFGCTDCSEHFQKMATTMPGNVSSTESSISWLWKAHNSANKRLSGDKTEDPQHIKVQFPTLNSCPKCYDNNQNFVEFEVLDFLRNMYTNLSYLQWSDLPTTSTTEKPMKVVYSKRLRHGLNGDDTGYKLHDTGASTSTWDFNIFDISLCVVLYVSSVVMLLLVCVKFIMKKNYKRKTSNFDFFHSKV